MDIETLAIYFSWFLTGFSLLGNLYVIKKNVTGQWIWAISNVGWVTFHLYKGIYAAAFLFAVYFILCVWGIIVWTKDAKKLTAEKA